MGENHIESVLTLTRHPLVQNIGVEADDAEPRHGRGVYPFYGEARFSQLGRDNPGETIQGGFLAAMLETPLARQLLLPAGIVKSAAALLPTKMNLNLNFIAPAAPGYLFGFEEIQSLQKLIERIHKKCERFLFFESATNNESRARC